MKKEDVRRKVEYRIKQLASDDAWVRATASNLLLKMGEDAVPSLMKAISESSEVHSRAEAAAILIEMREKAVWKLEEAIYGEDSVKKVWACQILCKMGELAIPALEKAMRENTFGISEEAADALGDMGAIAVPVLVKALHHRNSSVRGDAARGLARVGEAGAVAIPKLVKMLDESYEENDAAAYALSRMGKQGIEALVDALKDKRENVEGCAYRALCSAGVSALPLLMEASQTRPQLFEKIRLVIDAIMKDAAKNERPTGVRRVDPRPAEFSQVVSGMALGPRQMVRMRG